jgi:hypothetical protein
MSYCQTHGRFDDYFNRGCPQCKFAEEELRNAVEQAAYTSANPGDYDCPLCKYRSLREGASRCPLCHGEIKGDYWNAVWAKKKVDAEAAAERKRAAVKAEYIRSAAVRAAAANRERAKAHSDAVNKAVLTVFLILLGCSIFSFPAYVIGSLVAIFWSWNVGVLLVVVTFIGSLGVALWRIQVEVVQTYKDSEKKSEEKRRKSL